MVDEEDIIKIGKEIIPNIYDDGAKPAIKEMGNFIARPLITSYQDKITQLETLKKKLLQDINGLFKNIDDYYRVANSIEIDNFKQFDIIKFTSDFEIKTNNLRMLALLEDDEDLDLSDNSLKSTLLTSYSKYPQQEFKEENGVFIINSNKSLTCFLKLVLGRLYTNPITQHQMEANYARKLN